MLLLQSIRPSIPLTSVRFSVATLLQTDIGQDGDHDSGTAMFGGKHE